VLLPPARAFGSGVRARLPLTRSRWGPRPNTVRRPDARRPGARPSQTRGARSELQFGGHSRRRTPCAPIDRHARQNRRERFGAGEGASLALNRQLRVAERALAAAKPALVRSPIRPQPAGFGMASKCVLAARGRDSSELARGGQARPV
jgi:hypothetical protein